MIEKQPLELNPDFQYVLNQLEQTNRSLFITGRAGTGKSTLLQLFKNTTRKKTVVLAPTGIAALNVGGQTIHSFFGFPPKPLRKEDIRRRRNRSLYRKLEILIIDEISMVRADMLDNIDYFLRLNRENPKPFGGVQLVFFGDLFQLPPVVSTDVERQLFQTYYDSPYFFSAKVLQEEMEIEMIELRKVYRQEARHFIRLLDAVRSNQLDFDDLEDLNERYEPDFEPEDFYITLSTRNAIVNSINQSKLSKNPSEEFSFIASVTGDFHPRLFPAEAVLKLKLGAQVMFVKNDPKKQFVNGTIGMISHIDHDNIEVLVEEDGKNRRIVVEKMEWEILKYKDDVQDANNIKTDVVGTFKQYPLRLAWAITIHKSQGKTFEKVIIDLGRGAFEHGQTYVALSRCRTLEGIVLKQPLRPNDIMVDDRIVSYYEGNYYK
ncbi:MAG: DEAD/DEAH box helicase [Bacteroidota bacterium]